MSNNTHSGVRASLRVVTALAPALAALPIAAVASFATSTTVEAKTPGARYCFVRACHRVMTLTETQAAVGKPTRAVTSFYDDCRRDPYNPCGLTSSGEAFRPGEANSAASPIYPDGTVVLVRNPANGESAIVRINNAGPYWGNRTLDLSRAAGSKLGLGKVGVAKVEVTVLRAPSRQEATYRKGRVYPPLPGHVGRFASLAEAQVFAAVELDLPGAIGAGMIAVAHADPQAVTLSPVGYEPLTGSQPGERRLPAEVVRVSSVQPVADRVNASDHRRTLSHVKTASLAPFQSQSLVIPAVEISGAALLVPPAGETTRVVNPRAAIVGALRAGDFDRLGKSLLKPANATDCATPPGDNGPQAASLAAVSAHDSALSGVETLTLERMPPLATRGERGWYRRASAAVSHVVKFAPADVTGSATNLALWSALHQNVFETARLGQHAGNNVPDLPRVHVASLARVLPLHDRLRPMSRGPGRGRHDDILAA